MQRGTFRIVGVVMLLSAFGLIGCSDFDEMKSQRLLIQAETLLSQSNQEEAELALADLVARYPATQAAEQGRRQLESLWLQRESQERQEFSKVLDSFRQVLNGYQSLYAEYPRSISELDGSGYFFDSSYLEEVTPDGYQVYLFLQTDGAGYRAWCVREDLERGYALSSTAEKLISFEREKILERIKERFRAEGWNAKVVALHARQ